MGTVARYTLSIGAAAALLGGCGGQQPPIGALDATNGRGDSLLYNKTFMNAAFATPGINNDNPGDPYFQLGQTASPFPNVAGITTTIKALSPSDFGGHYAMNQIYDVQPSPVPSNVTPWPSTAPGESWDDGCWLYNENSAMFNTAPPDAGPGNAVTYGPTYDSPGEELGGEPTLTSLTLDWLFTDTFLFRPDSSDNTGIWVTIAQRQWSWGAMLGKRVQPLGPLALPRRSFPQVRVPRVRGYLIGLVAFLCKGRTVHRQTRRRGQASKFCADRRSLSCINP